MKALSLSCRYRINLRTGSDIRKSILQGHRWPLLFNSCALHGFYRSAITDLMLTLYYVTEKKQNGEYLMDLFDVLNLIGGLSLFLFGMTIMGQSRR